MLNLKTIVEALSAISSGLKIIEGWEKYGPTRTSSDVLTLNLEVSEVGRLVTAAQQIQRNVQGTGIDNALENLFSGTRKRVERCITQLNDALDSDQYLPQQRGKFGAQGRNCVCEEIRQIRNFLPGAIPPDLNELWHRHGC